MKNQDLIQVQRLIEQFFYKVRVNIALHNIMQSHDYADFRKQMRLAIENQILFFAKIEKVNQVVGTKKLDDIEKTLLSLFPLLAQFIEKEDFKKYLQASSEKGADAALNVLGTNQEYDVATRMDGKLDLRVPTSMEQIDTTTVNWIAKTIRDAMDEGLSSYETARKLKDEAKRQAQQRADVIAEQEAAWALGETQLDVYKEAGVERKKLITSRDEGVCVICMADEEAGEIAVNDPFPSGAVGTPIHIHCRCFVLPVMSTPLPITLPN